MMYQKKFILPGDGEGARPVQDEIIQQVEAHDYNTSCTFAIRLALEEALSNAIKHGCKMDPQKEVTLDCSISDEVIEINIQDQGPGFNPEIVPDPTVEENLEIPSGRGLVLMRSFMTDVEIQPPGNRVRLRYKKS